MNDINKISVATSVLEAPIEAVCKAALKLQPEIRARALKMERAARLDDDLIDALDEAGVFSLLVPKRWGGPGLGMAECARVSEIIGGGDLSTNWVSGFYLIHEFFVCRFPLEVQQQVYDGRSSSRCAAVWNPPGRADRVSGGWRLTGKWGYASGIVHARYILLPAIAEGVPTWFLAPRQSVQIIYDWEMGSMCATGSHTVAVEDLLVADAWSMPIQAILSAKTPEEALHPEPIHRLPFAPLSLTGLSSIIGALDYALELTKQMLATSKPYGVARMDREASRIRWAQAQQILQVVRMMRDTKLRELDHMIEFGSPAYDEAATGKAALDGMFVSHAAKDAMRLLMDGSGTSVYKLDSPVRRIAGDLAMMSTHVIGYDYDVLMDRNARWALGLGLGAGDPSVRLV